MGVGLVFGVCVQRSVAGVVELALHPIEAPAPPPASVHVVALTCRVVVRPEKSRTREVSARLLEAPGQGCGARGAQARRPDGQRAQQRAAGVRLGGELTQGGGLEEAGTSLLAVQRMLLQMLQMLQMLGGLLGPLWNGHERRIWFVLLARNQAETGCSCSAVAMWRSSS